MKRVMIVDDNKDITQLFGDVLHAQNYVVEVANCGEECLRKVERFNPDMILLDIMMPDMDGWEVLEELKKRGSFEPRKIALFSVRPLFAEDRKREGFDQVVRYIQKPIFSQELIEEITSIFQEEEN